MLAYYTLANKSSEPERLCGWADIFYAGGNGVEICRRLWFIDCVEQDCQYH